MVYSQRNRLLLFDGHLWVGEMHVDGVGRFKMRHVYLAPEGVNIRDVISTGDIKRWIRFPDEVEFFGHVGMVRSPFPYRLPCQEEE